MSREDHQKWLARPDVQKKLAPIIKVQKVLLELLSVIDGICRENNLRYYLFYGTLLGAIRDGGFIPWDDDADVVMPREDYEKLLSLPVSKWPDGYFLQSPYSEKYGRFAFSKLRKNNTACIDPHHRHIKMHQGIFLDIFPLDSIGESTALLWIVPRVFERLAAFKCAQLPETMHWAKPLKTIWEKIAPSPSYLNRVANILAIFLSKKSGGRYLDTFNPVRTSDIREGNPKNLFEPARRINFNGISLAIPKCSEEILCARYGSWQEWPSEEHRNPTHSDGGVIDSEKDYSEYLGGETHVR